MTKQFGYKCKLFRDLYDEKNLYDIIIPIEKKLGKEKLMKNNLKNRMVRNRKVKSKNPLKVKLRSFKKIEFENMLIKTKPKKMYLYSDFETDESMKDIDYQDIKSDRDEQSTKDKHSIDPKKEK